ncbi:MAG: CPBP family intramembrane glutamic endopeptidase [Pedobacter sp.]|nr:CPBP family intramembrane glutamic endopeptidase [Pedobacter sp.]
MINDLKLMPKTEAFHRYLKQSSGVVLISIFVIGNLISSIVFALLSKKFGHHRLSDGFEQLNSPKVDFWILILIAPVFETIIFQYAIIETFRKRKSLGFACVLSAIIFGLSHLYNFYYFLFAVCSGLSMAYLFSLRKSLWSALFITITAHSLYNLCVYLLINNNS